MIEAGGVLSFRQNGRSANVLLHCYFLWTIKLFSKHLSELVSLDSFLRHFGVKNSFPGESKKLDERLPHDS